MAGINGKRVTLVDLYEARTLRDAISFRAFRTRGPGNIEFEVPQDVAGVRPLIGQDRVLLYAVAPAGRAACVTTRTLEVYDACVAGERDWN
jgi:hypothetical protein